MPVRLPEGLPALAALAAEGVDAAPAGTEADLTVCVYNLMPKKLETELQLARMLGSTAATVDLRFAAPQDYAAKNAPDGHLDRFYMRGVLSDDMAVDALVLTGAPIETMDFEAVTYWDEITALLEVARTRELPLLSLCWGAQAALYHYDRVPKRLLPVKRFGVYAHDRVDAASPFLARLSATPVMPVSRWTETRVDDLAEHPHLRPLLLSPDAGLGALFDARRGHLHVLNHFEYDAATLDAEYRRDLQRGDAIHPPEHYYPDDDPARPPTHAWRADARAFYGAWVDWLGARCRKGR